MAERAQVIVPALAHFNKVGEVDVLSKIPGTSAWIEAARAASGIADDQGSRALVTSQVRNDPAVGLATPDVHDRVGEYRHRRWGCGHGAGWCGARSRHVGVEIRRSRRSER
jgi:hypothetical protein